MCRSSETPLDRVMSGLQDLPGWLAEQPADQLGDIIIKAREIIDRTEAMAAEATGRFEKAGGYKADGFTAWSPGYESTENFREAPPPSESRWPTS